MLIMVFFILLLSAMLTFLFIFFSEKSSFSTESLSPYECGFEPISSLRSSFSVRFFLMAILFVVFDVELCLLIPIMFCLTWGKTVIGLLMFVSFMVIMFLGLYHEYREGSLEWVI